MNDLDSYLERFLPTLRRRSLRFTKPYTTPITKTNLEAVQMLHSEELVKDHIPPGRTRACRPEPDQKVKRYRLLLPQVEA